MSTAFDHPRIREIAVSAHFHGGPADGLHELVLRHLLPEGLRPYCDYQHGSWLHRYESTTTFTADTVEIEVHHLGASENMDDLTER